MMGRKEMRAEVIQTKPTSTGTDLVGKTINMQRQRFVDFLDKVKLSDGRDFYLLVIH